MDPFSLFNPDIFAGVNANRAAKENAGPDYYQSLSLSLLDLPQENASEQVLRPPGLLDLAAGGMGEASGHPATPPVPAVAEKPASPEAGPWGPAGGADLFAPPPVAPLPEQQAQPPLMLHQPPQQQVQPQLQLQLQLQLQQQYQLEQLEQQQQQLEQQQLEQQRQHVLPPQKKQPVAQRKRVRSGRPEAQREKRSALNDLFLRLKRVCYLEAMEKDPSVTASIGRGKRSVNSKESILRKAARDVAELTAKRNRLEAEVAELLEGERSGLPLPQAEQERSGPQAKKPRVEAEAPTASVAEATVRGSATFRADYEAATAARFLTAPSGTLLSFSAPAASVFGMPHDALTEAAAGSMSVLSLLPAAARPAYYAALTALLSGAAGGDVAPVPCTSASGAPGRLFVVRCNDSAGRCMSLDHLWVASA